MDTVIPEGISKLFRPTQIVDRHDIKVAAHFGDSQDRPTYPAETVNGNSWHCHTIPPVVLTRQKKYLFLNLLLLERIQPGSENPVWRYPFVGSVIELRHSAYLGRGEINIIVRADAHAVRPLDKVVFDDANQRTVKYPISFYGVVLQGSEIQVVVPVHFHAVNRSRIAKLFHMTGNV